MNRELRMVVMSAVLVIVVLVLHFMAVLALEEHRRACRREVECVSKGLTCRKRHRNEALSSMPQGFGITKHREIIKRNDDGLGIQLDLHTDTHRTWDRRTQAIERRVGLALIGIGMSLCRVASMGTGISRPSLMRLMRLTSI